MAFDLILILTITFADHRFGEDNCQSMCSHPRWGSGLFPQLRLLESSFDGVENAPKIRKRSVYAGRNREIQASSP